MADTEEEHQEKGLREDNEVGPDNLSGDFNQDDHDILVNPAEPTQVSLFKIVAIIIKTIIGAHIVLIPYCASILGYILFPIILIVIIATHHYTSILLLKCKNLARHSNFSTILFCIWNNDAAKIFGAALMMVNNLAFCILEFVLIKTTIVAMIQKMNNDGVSRQYLGYIIIPVMSLIELPFIFTKRIEKLRIFSIIGIVGIVVFILGVVILFVLEIIDGVLSDKSQWSMFPQFSLPVFQDIQNSWLYIPTTISIIIFALNFHMNFFPIYKGLKDPTDNRMRQASLAGLTVTAIIYLIIGLMGYRIVGKTLQTNFLKEMNYTIVEKLYGGDFLYLLINISYIISILFNVVLMFFTCKNNFISIVNILREKIKQNKKRRSLLGGGSDQKQDDSEHSAESSEEIALKINRQYKFFTIFLYLVFIITSLFLQRLQDLFSILGAICSTTMVIILPCIFYVMLIRRQNEPKQPIYHFSIVIIAISIPFSIFSFISTYIVVVDKD